MKTTVKVLGCPNVVENEVDGVKHRNIIFRLSEPVECYRKPIGDKDAASILRKDKSLSMMFSQVLYCLAEVNPDVADMNLTSSEMSTLLTGAVLALELENHEAGEKYVDAEGIEHTYEYNCTSKTIKSFKFKNGVLDEISASRKRVSETNDKAAAIFSAAANSKFTGNVTFAL